MNVSRRIPAHRASLVALAFLLAVVAAACPGYGGSSAPTSTGSTASSLLPATPTALPEFDAAMFQRLLTQLRGTPAVVNVWASWCGPCTREAPELATVSSAYRGRVQFVGVDIEDELSPARAFIERYGWIYPSVFDPTGAIRNSLGLLGQPVTIIYDRSGKKVFTWSGATSAGQIQAELEKLVGS
jgi:cytochrome c biogenesis protein CcmG/thiol:disulfide interchange protein DsbE